VSLLQQDVRLPQDVSWKGVEQWLRRRGAGGEVLLVFENTEAVQLHEQCAKVSEIRELPH
jgi:hypothetical protein